VLLIVIENAAGEAIHEDGHGGDGETTKGGNLAGLGHASGNVASQEGGAIGVKDLPQDIGDNRVVGHIHDGELHIGIGFGGNLGGIGQEEANGDDEVALLFDEEIEVLLIIRNFLRFQVFAFHTVFGDSLLDTLPGSGVEGLVIDTASVGDLADFDLGGRRSRGRASRQRERSHHQDRYNEHKLLGHTISPPER